MSLRQRPSAAPSNDQASTFHDSDSDAAQSPPPPPKSALSQALESTSHLANLLPTGTVLAFQLLTPIFTNNGSCDAATRPMTLVLLLVLAVSCLLASFTDSIKAADGRVHYGLVTLKGLWLFDRPIAAARRRQDLSKYGLSLMDVIHAALSVLVFAAVALRDKNVVSCLYPEPGPNALQLFKIAPFGIGFIASLLFVVFPTRRHGIGYPVARDTGS